MKNLVNDISIQIDEGKISTAPKGTKKSLTAKAMPNDPNDPNVLVRGFGVMRKSQAEKTGMTYEPYKSAVLEGAAAENPMSTYGMKGQSAQSMAGSMQRGPTQQEMIKAQKHMEKEHDPGHKMIGLTVGLDGKAQVKSAITQTSVVGEPVKKPAVKEETELDEMNNSGLHPGWMLKKDKELGKKVKDAKSGYKDLKKYAGKKIEPKEVKEAVETKIQMTMPLFIRIMEWAKEEAKDDVALHQLAEKLAAVNGVADMNDYATLLESPQAWAKTATYAANELPNEVINASLAAFGTGDHEENKKSIKRSQKLQNILKRSIRLMSRKKSS